jgi:hypothetical protein
MDKLYVALPRALEGKIGFPSPNKLMDPSFTQNKIFYFRLLAYNLPFHDIAISDVDRESEGAAYLFV